MVFTTIGKYTINLGAVAYVEEWNIQTQATSGLNVFFNNSKHSLSLYNEDAEKFKQTLTIYSVTY